LGLPNGRGLDTAAKLAGAVLLTLPVYDF